MKPKGLISEMVNFDKMRKQQNLRNDNTSFNISKIKSQSNLNDGRSKKLHTEVNSLNNSVSRSKEKNPTHNSTQKIPGGLVN